LKTIKQKLTATGSLLLFLEKKGRKK